MNHENAQRVLRDGSFQEIVEAANHPPDSFDVGVRIAIAYGLALAGDMDRAAAFADIPEQKLTLILRSQLEATHGLVKWRAGRRQDAWTHFNRALQLARESRDAERIAFSHLHLLRFALDANPADAIAVALPLARRAVIEAGISWQSAYLHTCVAAIEGSRGNLDEAWRHCNIAESLLELKPNPWVRGACLLNRGAIATFRCEFARASGYFRGAIDIADQSGTMRTRGGAEINIGYLQLVTGEFDKAEATLTRALNVFDTKIGIDARDFLARVFLARGDFQRCEKMLDGLDLFDPASGYPAYASRWTAITKTKLLLKRQQFGAALECLATATTTASSIDDRPFKAAVHLLSAHALHRLGRDAASSRELLRSDLAGIHHSSELQGQFHYTVGMIGAADDPAFARSLQERGRRIWASQGIVSLQSEIDDGATAPTNQTIDVDPSPQSLARILINSVAAAVDLAGHPRLLGIELLNIVKGVNCARGASLTDTVDHANEGLDSSGRRLSLRLGDGSRVGKSIVLSADVPSSPADAIVLGDIFRIGRAALALEKARQEERSRAALWPAEPIEEQAGALFLAEEMHTLLDTARRVAAANIPVLITGETGTGKEVLARLIHSYSPRAAKTLLPFNCTATPREMLDAQLFGYRKGAFTGAVENFPGVIRAAAGGTLFLDEIGESTLDIQPKLLRFLESGEVHPMGETHPHRVDVRVIAATNADLDALVAQGRFREDLFYRLNIVRLHVPPLRERRVEIPAFANHYLQKYAKEMNKGDLRLAEETMEYLVLYRWPGNVRQIANEMRRLAALAEPGAVLMPEHLASDIAASRRTIPAAERTLEPTEFVVRLDQPLAAAFQHVERTMVQAAMAKTNSVDEAARLLGVSRKGLYLKRLRYGVAVDRAKPGDDGAGAVYR